LNKDIIVLEEWSFDRVFHMRVSVVGGVDRINILHFPELVACLLFSLSDKGLELCG
jgi:hypothetical protein